jgi:electron transfer flavoprotein beta subunit
MPQMIVCIKQVPMVSELPWDARTGTLRRDAAEGMMNPACACALEAALQLKQVHGGRVTVISMGPPMAEEVLREALAMGADRGILLTDPEMAGADTAATAYTLARAIETMSRDYDLVLCGAQTSDSETAQVGPQLCEELAAPGAAYVQRIDLQDKKIRVERTCDHFFEVLEMPMPALVTISGDYYTPRYIALGGVEQAFETRPVEIIGARSLHLEKSATGATGSPTKILDVYSPVADRKNVRLKGAPKKMVDILLERFGDKISGAIGKDLLSHEHLQES